MDIKDRINFIMEREKMGSKTFADNIGIQQSTLSHVLNGRNNPSLDVIMKVHQRFNYIRLEWLLYGQGEITEPAISSQQQTAGLHPGYIPNLFDENPEIPTVETVGAENRKEIGLHAPEKAPKETVRQEVRYIEKPHRKITEIRIFFDDNTYETFKGEK